MPTPRVPSTAFSPAVRTLPCSNMYVATFFIIEQEWVHGSFEL